MNPRFIFIAGPTASGKSYLALSLAQQHNMDIINTDSLQVYASCPLLTAQPTLEQTRTWSHHLYNYVHPQAHYSVAHWLEDVSTLLQTNKPFIFVGGTGLYFYALIKGLAAIPSIPLTVRQEAENEYHTQGADMFHAALQQVDPLTAAKLHPSDKQRLVRAMSVYKATQTPLSCWQKQATVPLIDPQRVRSHVLLPPKEELHKRAEVRFTHMLEQGVCEEVKDLLDQYEYNTLSPTLLKAIGFEPIRQYIQGNITKETMIEQTLLATRQYIKRQYTWFRNQPLPHQGTL